jgi:hypothetical protein
VVAAAVMGINTHNEQVASLQLDLDKERLRAQFMERAAGVHGLTATDRRAEELASLVKWYRSEIASVCNKAPGKCDPDIAVKEAEAHATESKKGDLELRKEFAAETKALYDTIVKGAYHPMATALLEGVRIDLLSLKRAQVEGKSRLRLDVAIWNAPQEVEERGDPTKAQTLKKQLNFGFKGLSYDCFDDEETKLGGAMGGGPNFVIEAPERWYTDFPPQGALAVWYLDPIPEKSATLDLRLSGDLRSASNVSIPVSQQWTLIVDPSWPVHAGETFDGKVQEMPEEEMKRGGAKGGKK